MTGEFDPQSSVACAISLTHYNRQYLWLTAEGWIYLVLSLLEMVSHLLPAGRQGAQAFKALDTVLGMSSSVL